MSTYTPQDDPQPQGQGNPGFQGAESFQFQVDDALNSMRRVSRNCCLSIVIVALVIAVLGMLLARLLGAPWVVAILCGISSPVMLVVIAFGLATLLGIRAAIPSQIARFTVVSTATDEPKQKNNSDDDDNHTAYLEP